MSLIQFLRILIARRVIILSLLLGCTVLSVVVASFLPQRFPAEARILLDVIKPDPVTGSVIATQFVRSYTKTQIELIKDYRVAGEVVDKLGWAKDPVRVEAWRKKTGGEGDLRRYLAQQIIDRTDANLVETSNILEITYQAPNEAEGRAVVGAIRDAYLDAALRFRTDSAGRTADWYRLQAEKAQAALTVAETTKSNFERANGIVMGAGGAEAETAKLQGLQGALLAARGTTSNQEFAAAQTAQSTGIVDQLKMQLSTVNDSLQQASERLGTAHPAYLALLQRRTLLTRELATETAAARSVSGGAAASSQRSVAKLESDYNAQKAKVLGMKGTLDQLGALQREVDLRRSQYEKAAARTADLKLEADVAETGLVNLGDPVGSTSATFPNMPLVWALSIIGGLVLGVIVAITVELFGRRVRGSEDLQAAARVPVLAVIGSGIRSPFRAWLRRVLQRRRTSDIAALQPAQ